jgi:outer membrane biosynthesis protein TonB
MTRRRSRLGRTGVAALSVAAHGLILLALVPMHGEAPLVLPPQPISVTLVPPPRHEPRPEPSPVPDVTPIETPVLAPVAAAPTAEKPKPARAPTKAPAPAKSQVTAPPMPSIVRPTTASRPAETLPAGGGSEGVRLALLSGAQLEGAMTAGSGGGGASGSGAGDCDMIRRLQEALRRDPEVRAAVSRAAREGDASGKAILVWNGAWLRSPGESGEGLAGVREAVMMEVAFAPEACRAQPVRGLVLLALNDGSRLALGGGQWRWTDLLGVRRR